MSIKPLEEVRAEAVETGKSPLPPQVTETEESGNAADILVSRRFSSALAWALEVLGEDGEPQMGPPIAMITIAGVDAVLAHPKVEDDQKPMLRESLLEFLVEVVNAEAKFYAMLNIDPDKIGAYALELERDYRQISERMRDELPSLSWVYSEELADLIRRLSPPIGFPATSPTSPPPLPFTRP